MDLEKTETGIGLRRAAAEAIADPRVQTSMVADGVDPGGLAALLRYAVDRLARQDPARVVRPEDAVQPAGGAVVRLVRGFVLAVVMIAGIAVARPAAADSVPVAFIGNLGSQALQVIRSDMPLNEKANYFEQMIREDFDLSSLCRFVLGPQWRVAQPAQREEFCDLFANNLVRFYGRQLAGAGDGTFSVTGSRADSAGVVVTSRIVRPQAAPIAVDWRLGVSDGHYRIEDVAIDGVSLALAQRAQIAAMIGRGGGRFGVLLATMRQEG
jgi:phospholipid transport system substrate-binding protein